MSGGAGDELRLALFSPLPPAPSGIADYVADLLPALPDRWRIDAFVSAPEQVDAAAVPRVSLRSLDEAVAGDALDGHDLCLYQVGNGSEHLPVLPLVRSRPGLLVLHDAVLHPARVHGHAAAGDLDGYRRVAHEANPELGGRLGNLVASGLWGPSTYWTFPLCEDLVRASVLTAVHGELTASWLRALAPGAAITTVEHWRAVPEADAGRVAAWRRRLGADDDTPLIGTFGHVGPAHGVDLLLEAAGELASRHDFRILVAGAVDPALELDRHIAAAGLEGRVIAPGRLPAADFGAAMRAVDLAVNLRYPTARASSGTLQQLLRVGVASIVHDLIHLRDLPDGAVLRVPPGPRERERATLIARLDAWLGDRDARAASAAACRAWAAARITREGMTASYVRAVEEALRRARAA